jgi:integrase
MSRPPKYVHGFFDRHGKPRFYFRRAGFKTMPLPGLPWSPEFMAAYEAGMKGDWQRQEIGAQRTVPGTVNACIVSYYNTSADFRDLADGTKKSRRAILERFREEHGEKRIGLLDKRALVSLLAKKKRFAARNWMKTLRGLIKHAIAMEMRQDDPTVGIKLPSPKTDGFHTWDDAEIERFQKRHPLGTRAHLALTLLRATGQSRADVVRMGRQHVQGGFLSIRRKKTGASIDIPVLPELREAVDLMPATDQLAFLTTEAGQPFTAAGFGGWFRERCDEAGLYHCTPHGLRKAAATRLAEAGATAHELMAWFGWTSIREAERYTKNANRKRLAESAGKLISGTSSGKPEAQFAKNKRKSLKS